MAKEMCYVTNKEPFDYALSIISGKWKLKIIYVLICLKIARYGELKKNIEGITHKMLSTQLDELEHDKIVLRTEYPEVPPKVEYSLTVKGESLITIVNELCNWGVENMITKE